MEDEQKITLITEPDQISKKRKPDESEENPYEDMNKQLRELYLLRQKNRGLEQPDQNSKKEGVIQIDLDNSIEHPEEKKTQTPIVEEKKIEAPKNQPEKPTLWLNKLRYYPNDFLQNNMVSFREMMYEDLLKGNHPNEK